MPSKILILDAGFPSAVSKGKLNESLAIDAKEYLEKKGHEVKITHMAQGYDIMEEVQKIVDADTVILQTPTWWTGLPWGAKKYIDEVMTAGMPKFQPGKKIMISATFNALKETLDDPTKLLEGKGAEAIWFPVYKTFEFCAFKKLPLITFHDCIKNADFAKFTETFHSHLDKYVE